MTTQTELDRLLTAFLDDGPMRAPDGPGDAALAHAHAHPRRPDPFRGLRRDPMGRPWFAGTGGLRALPLVAALGLLLVAAIAAGTVGGWFDRDPGIVVPPSPTPTPIATPTTAPTPRTFSVDLEETAGADATVEVVDRSGTLVSAASGTPAEGGSVPEGVAVAAVDGDPASVSLTWTLLVCASEHHLQIAADGRTMSLTTAPCEGDAMPRDLVLVLTFAAPVSPADLEVTLTQE
jgi:hypothetical protein